MKYLYLLAALLIATANCNAQNVTSSCTAPDSVIRLYKADAQALALHRIVRYNSPYKDSVLIPKEWSDSILHALIAVYNATTLPARDSVVKWYYIHSYYDTSSTHNHTVEADVSNPWVAEVESNIFPTSDTNVNKMITRYHLRLKDFYNAGMFAEITFHSDSACNIQGLKNEWMQLNGGDTNIYSTVIGGGSVIYVDTITPSYIQLTYDYACGDCPAGCTQNRYWQFRIYDDCSVEFVKSYGDLLHGMDCIQLRVNEISQEAESNVYPNPFDDRIIINNVVPGTPYTIVNLLGETCLSGKTASGRIIRTTTLAKGVYLLRLQTEAGVKVTKLVKE